MKGGVWSAPPFIKLENVMAVKIDLVGQRFGRLTVIKEAKSHIQPNGQKRIMWLCRCDCGNEVTVRGGSLKSGNTSSCGCLWTEQLIKRSTKHGYAKRGENHQCYRILAGMKSRCYRESDKHFKDYGGRGVTVCDEWKDNPAAFIEWCLKNGYRKGLQIDRIDNNGNYEPENCRFVTNRENVLNQRLLQSNNTSGYRGVSFDKQHNKWRTGIMIKSKKHNIGRYHTKIQAIIARDQYIISKNLKNDYRLQVTFKVEEECYATK